MSRPHARPPRRMLLAALVSALVLGTAAFAQAQQIQTSELLSVAHPQRPVMPRVVDFDGRGLAAVTGGLVMGGNGVQVWKREGANNWSVIGEANEYSVTAKRFIRHQGDAGFLDLVYAWHRGSAPYGSIGMLDGGPVVFGEDRRHVFDGVGHVWSMFGPVRTSLSGPEDYKVLFASDQRSIPGHTSDGAILYAQLPLASGNPPVVEHFPYVPMAIASADFNQDGRPDMAVGAWEEPPGGGSTIYHVMYRMRNANSTWGPWADVITNWFVPDDFSVDDVDGDGWNDIALNDDHDYKVFLNNHAGSFWPPAISPAPYGSFNRQVLADVNGDGRRDLIRTGYVPGLNGFDSFGYWTSLSTGSGEFGPPVYEAISVGFTPTPSFGLEPAFGDVNLDGKLDLLLTEVGSDLGEVRLGHGNGTFEHPPLVIGLGANAARTLALADVNHDGRKDVVVGLTSPGSSLRVLRALAGGGLSAAQEYDAGETVSGIAIGDANGDQLADVVLARDGYPPAYLPADGGGGLGALVELDPLDDGSGTAMATGLDVRDLNHDGAVEIVHAVRGGNLLPHLEVRESDHVGGFLPHADLEFTDGEPVGVVFADFGGSPAVPDLLTLTTNLATTSGFGATVFPGSALGATFGSPVDSPLDDGPLAGGSAHPLALAGNLVAQTVLLPTSGGLVMRIEANGAYGMVDVDEIGLNNTPGCVATGDVNHDGRLDFAVTRPFADEVDVYFGATGNTWSGPVTLSVPSPVDVQIGDMTGDGIAEIVVLSSIPGARPARASRPGRSAIDDLNTLVAFSGVPAQGFTAVEPPAPAAGLALAVAPNPARARTTLAFATSRAGHARLALYDVSGRRVATLVDGALPAGAHRLEWNGSLADGGQARPGFYLARLESTDGVRTARVAWIR